MLGHWLAGCKCMACLRHLCWRKLFIFPFLSGGSYGLIQRSRSILLPKKARIEPEGMSLIIPAEKIWAGRITAIRVLTDLQNDPLFGLYQRVTAVAGRLRLLITTTTSGLKAINRLHASLRISRGREYMSPLADAVT